MTNRRTIIHSAHIVTVDAADSEFSDGHLIIDDDTIVAVGPGAPSEEWSSHPQTTTIDARGHLITPGLINTHHHLYQWLTRGYAQDAILFDWLTSLYPLWSRIDAELVEAGALGAMAVAARSGCSTVGDHHYVFPSGAGDILGGIVSAATQLGVRLHATRGSMDLGRSAGGLPPDFAVETIDAILAASDLAIDRYHDASPAR